MPPAAERLAHPLQKQRIVIVAQYLLVDDRDGKVLAELASPQQALRLLRQLKHQPDDGPPVSLVKIDHEESSLTEITSMVSVRPLLPLMAPPRTNQRRDR